MDVHPPAGRRLEYGPREYPRIPDGKKKLRCVRHDKLAERRCIHIPGCSMGNSGLLQNLRDGPRVEIPRERCRYPSPEDGPNQGANGLPQRGLRRNRCGGMYHVYRAVARDQQGPQRRNAEVAQKKQDSHGSFIPDVRTEPSRESGRPVRVRTRCTRSSRRTRHTIPTSREIRQR
jgi:hypothetical protein